jgi:hypothetical protein
MKEGNSFKFVFPNLKVQRDMRGPILEKNHIIADIVTKSQRIFTSVHEGRKFIQIRFSQSQSAKRHGSSGQDKQYYS